MTNKQVQDLFTHYPYSEAKRLLIEECERAGHTLTGNESVFELRSLATQLASFSSTSGASAAGSFAFGNGAEPDNGATKDPHGGGITTGEPDAYAAEPSEPSQGEPTTDPQTLDLSQDNAEPAQGTLDLSQLDGAKPDEPKPQGNEPPKPEPEPQPEPPKRRRRKTAEPEPVVQTPDDKEKEAAKKIEEAKQLMKEAEEERERQRKLAQAMQEQNGKHHMIDEVVKRLKCLHKAFLVGPAGTGKSTLALCACKELFGIEGTLQDVAKSDKFAQISFSPDTITADMLGFTDVNGVFHETDIVRVFREGGVILFDEMDDADASLLVKLNTMLANGVIPTPNGMVTQNANTYIIGTANTYGTGGDSMYVGRSRLDAATLDRWKLATIMVDYDKKLEAKMCDGLTDDQKRELLVARTVIRDNILNNKLKQICSTRFVSDGVKMIRAGYSSIQILNTFLLSWPEQQAKMVKSSVKDAWVSKSMNE